MEATKLPASSADLRPPLRVVIAYNDIAAGKRAMHLLSALARHLGDEIEFQPLPWSFDLLSDVDWREVAASDAVHADILIIATSDHEPLPPAVGRWAETAIRNKQGKAAAVIALFGAEENPDRNDSSRLEAIQTAAQRAGLDFFAPTPHRELEETIARIHERAGMGSPVLQDFLRDQSTGSRLGRNV